MPGWSIYENPHGDTCGCDVCSAKRVQNSERLTSTDRLAWLERQVIDLRTKLEEIKKGNNNMGYALWCQTGSHSFDENEKGSRRMTVDEIDEEGKETGKEVTIHVCKRHVQVMFAPKKRSLKELQAEIAEIDEIGE